MNICFIGGGNMAHALIGGLLKRDFTAAQLRVVEINADNRAKLHSAFGVQAAEDISGGRGGQRCHRAGGEAATVARSGDAACAACCPGNCWYPSRRAYAREDLARWAGTQNVVRAMPNTPALIQSGITGLYALPAVSKAQCGVAQTILAAVGSTLWLEDEQMLDAVTAVSGSGPAYVFYFIESLQQAAQELGFNAEDARRLALDTFLGAAKLADASEDDVSVLRARVTSRNGTTERALLSLDANEVKRHIITAAKAAADARQGDGRRTGRRTTEMMSQALLFLLDVLVQPFAALLLLRFHLQWLRAPLRNPLGEFIMTLTDFLVLRVRRFIPAARGSG